MSDDFISWLLTDGETFLVFGLFWLLCAAATAFLASTRGKNSFKWFALALLMGPLAFIFAVRPVSAAKESYEETAAKKEQ